MATNVSLTEEDVRQLIYELIAVESAARESAYAQEILARQAGDESLEQLINQEENNRNTAISALQTSTNQSITRIDGNVTQLQILFNQRFQNINNLLSQLNADFADKVATFDLLREIILQTQANMAIVQGSSSTVGSIAKAEADIRAYVDTKVATIIDNAPEVLNTLKELADSIGNDGNFITTINNSIDGLELDISNESAERQRQILDLETAIASLGGQVGNNLQQAIENMENSLLAEQSARIAADVIFLQEAKDYSENNKADIIHLLSQDLIKKQKIVITEQHITSGYIELPHTNIVPDSIVAFIDRLGIFEGEDFNLIVSQGKTRLVFANSLIAGGNEEIESGAELRVKYWTL